jgi:hypothetical protein
MEGRVLMFDVSVYAYDTTGLGFSPFFIIRRTRTDVLLESKIRKACYAPPRL